MGNTDVDDEPVCEAMIHPGDRIDQPSYCDNDPMPGSDYCPNHQGLALFYDRDDDD